MAAKKQTNKNGWPGKLPNGQKVNYQINGQTSGGGTVVTVKKPKPNKKR